MSVSGTPVTTYDDGFPKAHPSLPPSTRRSGRGVVHRRTRVELTDDHGRTQACRRKVGGTQSLQVAHESLATRVVDPTVSTAERAGGGVGPWETRRRTSGQAYRQATGGRWARQSDRVSQGPTRPTRPVDRRRLGRHSFELRHYPEFPALVDGSPVARAESLPYDRDDLDGDGGGDARASAVAGD